MWRDEVDTLLLAGLPWADLLHSFAAVGQNGPLYFLLLRFWLAAAGSTEFSLRFFSVLFGVLAVPLVARTARRLFPTRSGFLPLLTALLVAISPYLVWYAQEAKMYTLLVVVAVLSVDRFLAAMRSSSWHRWLAYILVTSAAFYVHLTAVLIVPVEILLFLLLSGWRVPAARRGFLLSLAALFVPYLPLLVWELPLLLQPGRSGYSFVPLPDMLVSLLANYNLGVVGAASWGWLAPAAVLLAAASALASRPSRPAVAGIWIWLLFPPLALFLVSLIRPIYTARYLLFILPALLILLALGFAAIAGRSRLVAALLFVVLLVADGRGLWLQAHTPLKADFRAAARYVAARLGRDDLILFQIPHGRYSFDYYFPSPPPRTPSPPAAARAHRVYLPLVTRPPASLPGAEGQARYRWAEGPYTNAGMTPAELDRRLAELVGDTAVVWLVATEVPMWDDRGLVKSWLDAHGTLTAEAGFVRVAVYRFEFR